VVILSVELTGAGVAVKSGFAFLSSDSIRFLRQIWALVGKLSHSSHTWHKVQKFISEWIAKIIRKDQRKLDGLRFPKRAPVQSRTDTRLPYN